MLEDKEIKHKPVKLLNLKRKIKEKLNYIESLEEGINEKTDYYDRNGLQFLQKYKI